MSGHLIALWLLWRSAKAARVRRGRWRELERFGRWHKRADGVEVWAGRLQFSWSASTTASDLADHLFVPEEQRS